MIPKDCCTSVPWLEYHKQPVQLHSGGYSHWLVRGDLLYADPIIRAEVLDLWVDAVLELEAPFKQASILFHLNIHGVPHGGTPWAKDLRDRLSGLGYVTTLRDVWPEGDVAIVVDDVLTTGASLRLTPNAHQENFAHKRLVVVDRSGNRDYRRITAWLRWPDGLPLCGANG